MAKKRNGLDENPPLLWQGHEQQILGLPELPLLRRRQEPLNPTTQKVPKLLHFTIIAFLSPLLLTISFTSTYCQQVTYFLRL